MQEERPVRDLADVDALHRPQRVDDVAGAIRVRRGAGEVDLEPIGVGRRHVERGDEPSSGLDRTGQLAGREPFGRHLQPDGDRIGRARQRVHRRTLDTVASRLAPRGAGRPRAVT